MPVNKRQQSWITRVNYTNTLGEYKQKCSKYFSTKREA